MRTLENPTVKILISAFFIAMFAVTCIGQDYKKMAADFLKSKYEKRNLKISSIDFEFENCNGSLILLESSKPPCFALLKMDGEEYRIVGYSTANVFYVDPMDKDMATDYLDAIEEVPARKTRTKSGMTTNSTPVGPLCKTRWNQNRWYNRLCPYSVEGSAGERTYAGCVAVAIAQVIRYYGKWNDLRLGEDSAINNPDYNLTGMIDCPTNYEMDVCHFLADLGSFVDMMYGPTGSSCSFGLAWKDMQRGIYREADRTIPRQDDEWLNKIYKNLGEYHPVIIGGKGHAFVCDGYDEEGMLHFNLGWSGTGDGYYNCNSIGLDGYYSLNEAIIEAYPHQFEDFPSPERIYIDDSAGIHKLFWHAPERTDVSGYNVYYSDNEYITVKDTVFEVRKLKPGTHGMMVSALYPDGESIWIGPVWVHNPGREIEIREPSLVKALTFPYNQAGGNHPVVIRTEGELADMKSLVIKDAIDNFGILLKMPKLQSLTVNCRLAGQEDVELIQSLKNLQTLNLLECREDLLPDFKSLPKLVELGLMDSNIREMAFLDDIRALLALDLKGCTLATDFTLPSAPDNLEHLRIENVKIKTAGFLNNCINLRELKLVNCHLEELNSGSENPLVTCLYLDNNNLNNTRFLGRFPNLKLFSAVNNQIRSLEINAPLPYLYSIDLSKNRISKASVADDCKSLEIINLKDNQLIGIPALYHATNLKVLNLSGNDIGKLGDCVNTNIEILNISFNRLTNLNGCELFRNLKTLLAGNNRISDLKPLLRTVNGFNPRRIDLSNNPLSKESFQEVIPVLVGQEVCLQVPSEYEPASPCYPEVMANDTDGSNNLLFRWQSDSGLPDLGYDLYIGVGDSMWAYRTGIFTKSTEINLDKGQDYYWQVRANYSDTAFYSGLYDIGAVNDYSLTIPYSEDFERYCLDAGISSSSPVWKLTNGNIRVDANAKISNLMSGSEKGKTLHIGNTSDVSLRLSHIETGYLKIEMDQFVIPGKTSHICLNNISGLKVDMISDGNNLGIFLNESYQCKLEVQPDLWNHFIIVCSGSGNNIKIGCNNDHILLNNQFTDKIVRIASIQFGPVTFDTDFEITEHESYIDNLIITDGSKSASSESVVPGDLEISIFPNPADDYLNIEGLNTDQSEYTISIFSMSGQLVRQSRLESYNGRTRVDVRDFQCGIYVYQISQSNVKIAKGRLVVSR